MRRTGFTLAETLVAIFILFSTLVVFAALIDTALRYYAQIEKRNQAASVADRKYEEIREWARQPGAGGFNFDTGSWNAFTGPATDAYYPDMQVSVRSDTIAALSPSSELEQLHAPDTVNLSPALRLIEITVDWSDAIDSTRQLRVVYSLSAPARNLPLTVQVDASGAAPNPLPNGGTADFVARAYDNDGNPVPGLTYSWEVLPVAGAGPGASATIRNLTRSGRTAQLTNAVYADDSTGPLPAAAGNRDCRLRVFTRYHGQQFWGDSGVIPLAP